MQTIPDNHILELAGTPRQRGLVHGEIMRKEIQGLLERWKGFLARFIDSSINSYIESLVKETNFIQAVNKWTPGLLDEVSGMAEAANVNFNELFASQLLDEEWWFRQDRQAKRAAASSSCSSIGWKSQEKCSTLVAQNMDLPDYLDGFQIIMHIVDHITGVESLVFSVAGLVALNGLNNYGIGVVCNNLGQLIHSIDGLPVAFVHRGVLERCSISEAKAYLQDIPHASGQNYLLGCPSQIIDLECSANQVSEYIQPGRLHSVCHTNHPFTNSDFVDDNRNNEQTAGHSTSSVRITNLDSQLRMESIIRSSQIVEEQSCGPEVAELILSSHESHTNPVCRHPRIDLPWMTLGTSIMVLDEHPQLHFSPGPPCSSSFSIFDFLHQN